VKKYAQNTMGYSLREARREKGTLLSTSVSEVETPSNREVVESFRVPCKKRGNKNEKKDIKRWLASAIEPRHTRIQEMGE